MIDKKKLVQIKNKLGTDQENTWCPGCPDFAIMEAAKRAIGRLMIAGVKKENFVMGAGVGCHAKIFDYIDINGFYGLHGRIIPTMLGVTLGNPNLKVLAFAGDGDTYSEGMSHFIQAGRYNADMTLIVHDNQSFSLTTGQSTPTTQLGFKSKAEPLGEMNFPLNPVKLAIDSGVTFIARCNARDIEHTTSVMVKAIKHRGFSFVEIIQDCIVYNLEANNKEGMYKIKDNKDKKLAEKLAKEYDYNSKKGKIPLGVIYHEDRKVLEDEWPQLSKLVKVKKGWKGLGR